MQKISSIKFNGFWGMIKCALIGVVATLIGTFVFAFVLKFTNLSSSFINTINNFIKAISLFVALTCATKLSGKMIFKALFIGVIYSLSTFALFGIFNGRLSFNLGNVYDLVFAVITSVALAVIINLLSRKTN